MIRINILACSKSGSRFVLAKAGMGFCRLGSLDRRYCSRVRRSSSFPDSSIKGIRIWIPRSFYFLQKPDKSIFLNFVVCNKWSFHHNLNQIKFTSFCAYILYLSLHFTSFLFVGNQYSYWLFLWSPEKRWTQIDCNKNHQQDVHRLHFLIISDCLVSAFNSPYFAGLPYI